jgi:hypothetical protein
MFFKATTTTKKKKTKSRGKKEGKERRRERKTHTLGMMASRHGCGQSTLTLVLEWVQIGCCMCTLAEKKCNGRKEK